MTEVGEIIEKWPIFICYRRVDGSETARLLSDILHKQIIKGPNGESIELDVYLDVKVPGIADWRKRHESFLTEARAFIIICTPGLKLDEGSSEEKDSVHEEIALWLQRTKSVAPILIDPLEQGARYIPNVIIQRWPDIQRLPLLISEWTTLDEGAWKLKIEIFTDQIVKTILPSGAQKYEEALEKEKRLNINLKKRARIAWCATLLSVFFAFFLLYSSHLNKATGYDANAAVKFAQYRSLNTLLNETRAKVQTLDNEKKSKIEPSMRLENINFELRQLEDLTIQIKEKQKQFFDEGMIHLATSDRLWRPLNSILGNQDYRRNRPLIPFLFSVELLNAGSGESLLLHYGNHHDPKFILINTGPRGVYKKVISPRFHEISETVLDGKPVPIELVIIGDQDSDKSSGLLSMLKEMSSNTPEDIENAQSKKVKNIWFNVFGTKDGEGRNLRVSIRNLIEDLQIPLNKPFDKYVLSPDTSRAVVELDGGLSVTVLGPNREEHTKLHEAMEKQYRRTGGEIETLSDEFFSKINLQYTPKISEYHWPGLLSPECDLSLNAKRKSITDTSIRKIDHSVSNQASLILLFEFNGVSFLFTGDSNDYQIRDGLVRAKISSQDNLGFNLMSIPHLGSEHNTSQSFFEDIFADFYLFSGDGRFDNPSEEAISSLITARSCHAYTMYFANRGDKGSSHGDRLDRFFAEEAKYNPNYRREFRANSNGSVRIDLGEVLNY